MFRFIHVHVLILEVKVFSFFFFKWPLAYFFFIHTAHPYPAGRTYVGWGRESGGGGREILCPSACTITCNLTKRSMWAVSVVT